MKNIYTTYARYNTWANTRITEAFSTLSEEKMNQPVETSFPSARLTFQHIWNAELIWLNRLQGVSLSTFPEHPAGQTSSELFEGLLRMSADFMNFIENQPEEFFQKEFHFKTITSGEYSQRAFEMIHHCLNHSTYHRGQLVTIGRQLGLTKVPATDMIQYYRML